MKQLLMAEWERLWKRKVTWLIFFSIPIMLGAAAKYLSSQNNTVSPSAPEYTVTANFPILGLSELLMTAFNMIVLMFVAFVITDEYRSGQLRMGMIRIYTLKQIMTAKFIVIFMVMLLFFITYFSISYLIGYIFFPNPTTLNLFFHNDPATWMEGFVYNVKFYGIAFVTIIAMLSLLFFVAIISHSTTTTIGTGIGFILFSLAYPYVVGLFSPLLSDDLRMKIMFSSLPMIQYQGITQMLAETPAWIGWNTFVLCMYIGIFGGLSLFMTRKDTLL